MRQNTLDIFDILFNGSEFGFKFDTDKDYVISNGSIKIDLKGAKKENVSVNVDGKEIKVTSTKKNIHGETTKYEKTFVLTDKYDPTTVTAKYEDSILTISAEPLKKDTVRSVTID